MVAATWAAMTDMADLGIRLPHAAGAEMDVLFLRDHAVPLHEHQGDLFELGVDTVVMFEFDRVAVHDMTVAADHFDELLH